MVNNKYNLKLGIVLSYVQTFFTTVISFFLVPLTIKKLGGPEYGIYMMVGSLVPYISILDFGISNSVVKYISECRINKEVKKEEELISTFLIIYIFIALIVLLISIPLILRIETIFKSGLNSQEIEKVKLMMGVLFLYMALSFPLKIFQGVILAYENYVLPKLISFISAVVTPLLIIISLYNGYKAISLIVITSVIGMISGLIQMIYCKRILKIKLSMKKLNFFLIKDLFNYSLYIFIASIVNIIYWNTDNFILGSIVSSSEIAIYSIASKFNAYLSTFTMVFSGLLLPKVVKIASLNKNNEEIDRLFIKVSGLQLKVIGLIMLNFIFIGKEFIRAWVGENYINSYAIALMLMGIRIIPICQDLGTSILQAKNKHKIRSVVYIFIAILNLAISIPLAKKYGGFGCALGTVIGIACNIIFINIYYNYIGLNMKKYWVNFWKNTIPIILAGVLGSMLKHFIIINTWVSIFLFGLIFTSIYSIIIWNMGMTGSEKNIIIEPIKMLRKKNSILNKRRIIKILVAGTGYIGLSNEI